MHIRTIGYNATAAAVAGTAAAAMTGDSLVIENGAPGSRIEILDWFGKSNLAAGWHQLAYPSGHDTTRGMRSVIGATALTRFKPLGLSLKVQPQETLAVTISAAAGAGDVELGFLTIWYENLPGISGHFISLEELQRRAQLLTTVQASITLAATGAWAGAEAINAESDLLLANRDYAWVGAEAVLAIGAVSITAPDFGNVRVACPCVLGEADLGAEYFLNLALVTGLPVIPVLNSGNRANINLAAAADENGAATSCSFNLVLLSPS